MEGVAYTPVKLYKLPIVIQQPSDETEDKFMAEVPSLPGCRAWGDTPAEVLENLYSVAAGFIESYRSNGEPLPAEVEATSSDSVGPQSRSEMLVAV